MIPRMAKSGPMEATAGLETTMTRTAEIMEKMAAAMMRRAKDNNVHPKTSRDCRP